MQTNALPNAGTMIQSDVIDRRAIEIAGDESLGDKAMNKELLTLRTILWRDA